MDQRFSFSSLRWCLLLVPLWGWLDARTGLAEADGNFILLSLIAAGALGYLLAQLKHPARETLWVWVILLVFIQGYFIKTYWFASNIDLTELRRTQPELLWMSIQTITEGWYWITGAFVVFCLSGVFWLKMTRLPNQEPAAPSNTYPLRVRVIIGLALVIFSLYLIFSYIQFQYEIGIMGIEYQRLPWRLDTLLFRYRTNIAPALMLLIIWTLDKSGNNKLQLFPIALLGLMATTDSFISASRSSFIRFMLPVFFVWLLSDRLTKNRRLFLMTVVIVTLVAFPFVTTFRYVRIVYTNEEIGSSVARTAEMVLTENLGSGYEDAAQAIRGRVTGADGVWHMLDHTPDQFSVDRLVDLLFYEDLAEYYTRLIVGVSRAGDFRAIGFVGLSMLLGGWLGVIVLMLAYVTGINWLWQTLKRLRTSPVALSIMASTILSFTSEAGAFIPHLVLLLIAVWLCERLYLNVFIQVKDEADVRSGLPALLPTVPSLRSR